MRKTGIFFMAMTALTLASCSSGETENTNEETVEAVTYSLDKENSSLVWEARMSPEWGHHGTVMIQEGSITMEGDELKEGSFTIDMKSIKDLSQEEPKASILVGHLTGLGPDENHPVDMFFNVPAYPTVGVTLGDYKDGKLGLTLDILGKKLEENVAVELTHDDNGAAIKGDFTIDFDALEIPGLQPNPEDGSGINPNFDFKLDVKLKK